MVDKLFSLIERIIIPIILVVAFLLYQKFGSLFSGNKEEEKEREKQAQQHTEALAGTYKTVPKNATPKERFDITLENGEVAKRYKQALYAERIRSATGFVYNLGIAFDREGTLLKWAAAMKLHKVSLSGTATEYKRLTGNDMFKDVRQVMGGKYSEWLTLAGTVK